MSDRSFRVQHFQPAAVPLSLRITGSAMLIVAPAGRVNLSEIALQMESGRSGTATMPVIQASLPIIAPEGQVFGLMVLGMRLQSMLQATATRMVTKSISRSPPPICRNRKDFSCFATISPSVNGPAMYRAKNTGRNRACFYSPE